MISQIFHDLTDFSFNTLQQMVISATNGVAAFERLRQKWKICEIIFCLSKSCFYKCTSSLQPKTQGNASNLVQSHFGSPASKWLWSGMAPLVPQGFYPACWGLNQPPPSHTDTDTDTSDRVRKIPPKNGVIALWPNTRVVKCKYYVSQKQNGFNKKIH